MDSRSGRIGLLVHGYPFGWQSRIHESSTEDGVMPVYRRAVLAAGAHARRTPSWHGHCFAIRGRASRSA
jgi:hypothetical protein